MSRSEWSDEDLDDDEYPDDDLADDATIDMLPCPSCGTEIYEDAEQCPVCGSYVTTSSGSLVEKPLWWIVLGLLGVLAALWVFLRIP